MFLHKLILAVLLTSTLFLTKPSLAWDVSNPPGDMDKVLHVAWGAGTEALVSGTLTIIGVKSAPELGLTAAVITGVAKELADKNFDYLDALATVGGGVLAYVVDKNIRMVVTPRKGGRHT